MHRISIFTGMLILASLPETTLYFHFIIVGGREGGTRLSAITMGERRGFLVIFCTMTMSSLVRGGNKKEVHLI